MQGKLNCVFSFLHFTLSLTNEYRHASSSQTFTYIQLFTPFLSSPLFLSFTSFPLIQHSSSISLLPISFLVPIRAIPYFLLPQSLPLNPFHLQTTIASFPCVFLFTFILPYLSLFPIFCSPSFDFPLDSNNGLTIE